MRIAICGIGTESSTFSRHTTTWDDFVIRQGPELLPAPEPAEKPTQGPELVEGRQPVEGPEPIEGLELLDPSQLHDVEFVPIMVAAAPPGGPIDPDTFIRLEQHILHGLSAARADAELDGIYLDLHGAMHIAGADGAEERLLRNIRGVVADQTIIAASMDPHGNLSREFVELVDIATSHRHAPHIDKPQTRKRAVSQLITAVRRGRRPIKAWVRVPVLLPGERTSTVVEPGRTVFGSMIPAIEKHDVIDANMWIGFYWADEPRNSAAVLVTGWDRQAAIACAEELATQYWQRREDFTIVSDHHGSFSEAIDFVLADAPAPCFISDSGDNVTGGSGGDITFALHIARAHAGLQASGMRVLFAGLYDPAAVAAAEAVGAGETITVAVGAHTDDRFGDPVPGPWQVERLLTDPQDRTVSGALLRQGHLAVSVQKQRSRFITTDDPTWSPVNNRGLAPVDVADYDAVVVKNGYLFPGQAATAKSAFMAITPGGTDLDLHRISWNRIEQPTYPFSDDFVPDLHAVII